jgi:hypothetical protein
MTFTLQTYDAGSRVFRLCDFVPHCAAPCSGRAGKQCDMCDFWLTGLESSTGPLQADAAQSLLHSIHNHHMG